jgi:hypothetical protein
MTTVLDSGMSRTLGSCTDVLGCGGFSERDMNLHFSPSKVCTNPGQ